MSVVDLNCYKLRGIIIHILDKITYLLKLIENMYFIIAAFILLFKQIFIIFC